MRFTVYSSILLAFALAGCGSNEGASSPGDKAKANEAAAAAVADFKIVPGRYRSTVSIQKFSAEGMPPQMQAMMGKPRSFEYCITPEQAAQGMDGIKRQLADGKCQYESFRANNGTIDAAFTCSPASGVSMRATSKGTYSESGSESAIVADMTIPGGRSIHIEETVKAERIGDCAK